MSDPSELTWHFFLVRFVRHRTRSLVLKTYAVWSTNPLQAHRELAEQTAELFDESWMRLAMGVTEEAYERICQRLAYSSDKVDMEYEPEELR